MINDTYNNTTILTDDQKAKITAIADSIKTITYEIEVTGTVASEFTILPCVNGGSWNIARGSNPGGMFINNYNCTVDKVKVTGPGTYTVTTTVNDGISSSEILNKMWYLTSLEYHSKSFNPDMVMKLKSLTVEGEAAVIPELDYTALDEAIATAEAVDADKYTAESYAALTTALGTAKTVRENAAATQDDVDAAAKAITDAINALKIAIDYTELDTAIAIAEAVDADAYTAESYAALTTALGAAKAVKENADATQDDVDAAAKAITDAINALEEKPVDDGIYVKVLSSGTEDLSKRVLAKFAEGTANAAMAGATQVKVTFDMGPNAAFNQYMSFNVDGDVAGTTSTEKIKGNSWTNGEKNKFATVNLPKALAEGDTYSLSAWTAGFSNCNTEDNFVFGIKQAEFLDANGNVLYTHTQVEGPAAEDPNKVVVNGSEAFINQSNQFYLTLHTSGSDSNLISDDEWAKIQALAPNYTKFTFEVEVTGTVATPFTLVPKLDTTYSSDYDYWYIKPDANRGGPFISKDSDVTFESFQISEPGTYKLEVILADGTKTSELSDLVTISSLEYNTYTDNPDATVTFKSFTVESAAAVTPEIDYTELDKAIADAEAVDADAYTAESYAALTTALGAAKAVKENADATQDDVDAAAKAITDAIAALEEVPVDDGLYAKIYFKGYTPAVDDQFVIAEGTANAAMAGATQVKVTFDMGAKAAYNQMTKLNITGSVAGTDVTATLTGSGWPANGVKGNEKTFALPAELAAGDEYTLRAWTGNWESCKTEENYVFGIAKVEFLNASGEVLYTHTQVEGPAAEASDELNITGFDGKFVDSTDFGYQSGGMLELQINTSISTGEVKSILTDDQKAWITENADAITSITYEVEVAGTLDSPITLVTNSNGGEWNTYRYSTRGGYIINDWNCKTTSSQISEAGTYTVTVAIGRGYSSAELLNKAWYITTLESNSFTNNPNATLTLKSLKISTASEEIDYTALDKAIADAEALDASTYTASSFAKVTSALNTAKTTRDNVHASQEAIDSAAKALNDAIAALEIKPNLDYSKLEEAVKAAKEVDTSKYSSETAKALTDAIKAGEALLDSATATQADVDAAAKAITDAQNNLVEKVTMTVYIQSGSSIKSAEVELNGEGEYSAQIRLNNAYWYENLGGFMLTPCPEEGANYTIDVDSMVITSDNKTYTLIPTSNNKGIVPTGDMTRTDTNGLPNKGFDTNTIYASSEDGTAVLKPYNSTTMRLLVDGSMSKISYVTYNFTVKEKVERVADWTEADKWYALAKDLLANHKDEYTASGIADIEYAIKTYDTYNSKPETNQSTVDWLANLMKIRIEGAEKPSVSTALADLKKTIEQAEAIDTSEYTEETVSKLTEALEAAKAMDENSAYDDVRAADTALKNAISGLKCLPLEPFVYIYKNGEIASIASGKTDDQMAGATQIRFTFDCADDVSYNQYASIEFKAVINGTESYQKFPGTNGYTTGAKGLTETLDLTNAVAAGQSFTLEGFTYAWDNAADYVYAVTKVEFIDADGNVLKTIKKPEEISLDELNKAIEKAEAIDTTLYTDETVKALTDAIAAAKKVTTTSTEEEAQAAIDAINAAIEALEFKPVVTTYKVTGTVVVSDKATDTEMTLVAQAADGTKITTTATSMGEYVLEGLAAGEYTLTISGGKYVERTYEITVTDGDIAMEVNLNPLGDINGDGKVTTADVGMANSHAKGVNILEGYKFACADVKIDGTISTADVGMINSHAKDVKTLW